MPTKSASPDHFEKLTNIPFASAPLNGERTELCLDLSLPRGATKAVPLVMWIHGGGFRSGDKDWAGHRTDARWLTKAGYAFASINYRLSAGEADLSPHLRAQSARLERHRDPGFRNDLSGAAALAALEDSLAALNWLYERRDEYSLSRWIALGGNSAGAITAFNIVHLTSFLGLSRPAVRALFSVSGGFAYPGLFAPNAVPVRALHNPEDRRVDVASIRKVAAIGGDSVELIEARGQDHGRVRSCADEPARVAYARIIEFFDEARARDP